MSENSNQSGNENSDARLSRYALFEFVLSLILATVLTGALVVFFTPPLDTWADPGQPTPTIPGIISLEDALRTPNATIIVDLNEFLQNQDDARAQEQRLDRANTLYERGFNYLQQGQFGLARRDLENALTLYTDLSHTFGSIKALEGLGDVYLAQDQPGSALASFEEAHQMAMTGEIAGIDAYLLGKIGNAHLAQEEYHVALTYYQRSLSAMTKQEDIVGQGHAHYGIGVAHANLNEYEQSLASYETALSLYVRANEPTFAARTRENMGLIWHANWDYDRALTNYKLALSVFQDRRDMESAAKVLLNMGVVQLDQGHFAIALNSFEEAQSIYHEIGNRYGEAFSFHQIGIAHIHLDNYAQARLTLEEARIRYSEVGDRSNVASVLVQMGRISHIKNDYTSALSIFDEAQNIYEELDEQAGVAEAIWRKAHVHESQENFELANELQAQAQSMFGAAGEHRASAWVMGSTGELWLTEGRTDEARQQLEDVLDLMVELDNKEGIGLSYRSLGDVHVKLEDFGTAFSYFASALDVFRGIGQDDEEAITLVRLSSAHQAQQNHEEALRTAKLAMAIYERYPVGFEEIDALVALGDALLGLEDLVPARSYYDQALNLAVKYNDADRIEQLSELLDELDE